MNIPKPRDIERTEFPRWDPEDPNKWVQAAFQYAGQQADRAIRWYSRKRHPKRYGSQILRAFAILFSAIGTLLPLIDATDSIGAYVTGLPLIGASFARIPPNTIGKWGYVFLAFAASCVAADKFFGFSKGWVRFMLAQMALERALTKFEMDWAKLGMAPDKRPVEGNIDEEPLKSYVALLERFVTQVNELVQKETDEWVQEFHSRLAELNQIGDKPKA